MSRTLRVEHLGRVEGHGGITVELDGATLREVRFDLFEGLRLLEGLVRGRSYDELPQIVSRICSICSVSHALTAIKAIEAAFGIHPTYQTEALRDLLLRGENIQSHSLHLFFLAAPDFLGYPSAPAMAAEHPEAVALGLRLKKLGNRIQELLGGRAIHPVNAVPGGFARLPTEAELVELARDLEQGSRDGQEAIAFLATLPAPSFAAGPADLAALRPPRGYGYWAGDEALFRSAGQEIAVPVADLASAVAEQAVLHSHAKHSRFRGRPFMVGALARVTLLGDRLNAAAQVAATALGGPEWGANPISNNAAQAVELVEDLVQAQATVEELLAEGMRPERPVPIRPRAGEGVAATEAPRGILLHGYTFDAEGRALAANVITPTAFNAASVEQGFREIVGQEPEAPDEELTRRLEILARAYDPCISCSVHLVRRAGQA